MDPTRSRRPLLLFRPSRGARPASRQVQIVELDGLKLLLPLTQSKDAEVQRLAAHALANLSVNGANGRGPSQSGAAHLCCIAVAAADNQRLMADHGAADMLISLLTSTNEPVQRQAAKALANLGVNGTPQSAIASCSRSTRSSRIPRRPWDI